MTNVEDTLSSEETVSAPDKAVEGPPAADTPTEGFGSADPAANGHRHRRRVEPPSSREISQDRRARLWLLADSLIGTGCLVLAYGLQPDAASPFASPSGAAGWIALIAGVVGIWLVPGLWLSAVMMRTGVGPVARLATRIGTTLAWYALVGPVIHYSADGARVTSGGIVGVTVAATAAMSLGVALGLVRRPAEPGLRVLIATLVGGISAQIVIWLSMLFSTDDVNFEQIRRLDWSILLACALLTAIGAHSRPDLPMVRIVRHIRTVLISLAVVAVTALALVATGSMWSPAQRMPSAIGLEQVAAPSGSDVAFALTSMGPDGPALIQHAEFTAADDTGSPVAVSTRLLLGSTADPVTLLVVLDPASRPQLCEPSAATLGNTVAVVDGSEQGPPVKLTVRDQASGTLVQAVIPAEWCVP